ncbi:MAG TPA: hypothetical protein VFH47_00595 [Candidatus Thermoplasmatota archaeon]|nr:hypothetical protein [Candidatus Thermoplasmatota archaeon]
MARRLAIGACLAVGAVLAAFFLTFAGVFTDGPADPLDTERLVSLALVAIAHGVLGWAAARFVWRPVVAATAMAAPSVLLALVYGFADGAVTLALVYAVAAAAAAALGAWVAARQAGRRSVPT